MDENLSIQELNEKIIKISNRIIKFKQSRQTLIKNKGYTPELGMQINNNISELNKEKRYLELVRFDMMNGTHKAKIYDLEKKLMYFSLSLSNLLDMAKKTNTNVKIFSKDEVADLQKNIDNLQQQIYELEEEDKKILGRKSL